MNSPSILLSLLIVIVSPTGDLSAQVAGAVGMTSEWTQLRDEVRSSLAAANSTADLLYNADRLRAFYTNRPLDRDARNAKCLEGIVLLRAWLVGDESHAVRRQQVVGETRSDRLVDPPLRAELFAFADSVAIARRTDLSHDARLLAYEKSTRALITEFPELPNGYESLMHIARDSSEKQAPALAAEVAGMVAAPQWVKAEAQLIADRFTLVGQSLPGLAMPILGATHALAKAGGGPIIIYTWSAASLPSVLRAKVIAERAPAGAVIIGVCLDAGDFAAARAQAEAERLPGESIYNERGHRGELPQKLKLTEPGLIYVADAAGIIRSVSAQRTLDAALALAGQ